MKNKFTQIVKIRKQQMDKVETRLIQTRFKKEEIKQKIDTLYEEIKNSKAPTKGALSLISIFHENLKLLRREKDDYVGALFFLENEISNLQAEYKKAHMEFEKIKYLEEQEFFEHIKERKRKEKIDMDEIATMLFSAGKGT